MSVVNDIIKDIPLPNMVKVRQEFDRTRLENVAAEVRKCLERREILGNLRPGRRWPWRWEAGGSATTR